MVVEETVPDVTTGLVVLEVTAAIVVDDDAVVAVEMVPVLLDDEAALLDEIGLVEEVVWMVVVPLAVRAVEETTVELDATELGMEDVVDDEEEAEVAGIDCEDVVAPLVTAAVVELSFAVAPGKSVATPRARTKVTMTATVAPAAICLLNSDNCTRVRLRRYRPTF
ncbi:MAG: hypothetical protein ABSF83_00290 [Nitrososphaerales archaeon]